MHIFRAVGNSLYALASCVWLFHGRRDISGRFCISAYIFFTVSLPEYFFFLSFLLTSQSRNRQNATKHHLGTGFSFLRWFWLNILYLKQRGKKNQTRFSESLRLKLCIWLELYPTLCLKSDNWTWISAKSQLHCSC